MKLYACSHCKQLLYFENDTCLHCGHKVGFEASGLAMITLVAETEPERHDSNDPKRKYRFCENARHGTCNWLISPDHPSPFCQACELNRTIPTLSGPENLARWKRIEIAKHRMVYSLLRLHLPVRAKEEPEEKPEEEGIAFDFIADLSPTERVMTGHDHGVITLNIEEADEAERVRNKLDLGEKYRTLLGHFRHEIGHYYWDLLIAGKPAIDKFRKLFGDEQKDYAQSLKDYYKTGAPADWADHFISPYAASHPWEDWAETWSHYMHLMDALETSYSFGIVVSPREQAMRTKPSKDPYLIKQFAEIIDVWLPLTFAVNSLNRSMGHSDFYPFVISPVVMDKLGFIHEVCQAAAPANG
ncbi:MAG: putative zinc-binding peptidase [Puia sp.]|nr:putative zinc-binding peptidase [Puia sp.]